MVVLLTLVFGFTVFGNIGSQSMAAPYIAGSHDYARGLRPLFPSAYFIEYLHTLAAREAARPYWAASEREHLAYIQQESILINNNILLYYGHPESRNMGILGRHNPEELKAMLKDLAAEYRQAGSKNMVLGFYLIYGTVWPGGEIGILGDSLLREWIEFTMENDMLIFIDHQIGRFDPVEQFKTLLPWLRYPNVHLALDPEWRTTRPMREIGYLTAAEINQVQDIMEEYMIANNIPGERILMIHQFNPLMIRNRDDVRADSSRVRLVLCMDGIGSPAVKRSSYAMVAGAANIPVKSFKLFYNFGIRGVGFDDPLMSPREVLELNPRPYVIMYQ